MGTIPLGSLAALILIVGGALSCGAEENGGDYAALVRGLKVAALSGKQFDALDRSVDLSEAQRASLTAFCKITRDLLANGDGYKVAASAYYVSSIKTAAEEHLPAGSTHAVGVAVGRMELFYGLRSFRPQTARHYVKACYR